jgi:hypothetical protein
MLFFETRMQSAGFDDCEIVVAVPNCSRIGRGHGAFLHSRLPRRRLFLVVVPICTVGFGNELLRPAGGPRRGLATSISPRAVSIVLIPERFGHDPAGRADASRCPEERTSADQIRMNRQYTALPRQFLRVTDGRRITSMTALSANADQSHNARLQRLRMVL